MKMNVLKATKSKATFLAEEIPELKTGKLGECSGGISPTLL